MHHAPAGPPLSARVAGLLARARFHVSTLLAPLGTLLAVLGRTRVLPVALTGLLLGALALATPISPYEDGSSSTAALVSPSDSTQELVPATGDGWTQDGAPPETSRSERPSQSSSAASSSPPSSAAPEEESDDAAAGSSAAPSSAAAPETSAEETSSSSGSSAATDEPEAPSTPGVETPAADPAALVLAAVNAERTAAGCPALTSDAELASLAAERSREIDDDAPDDGVRVALAATGSDPAAVAADWLADDDDREDLLDCSLTGAGVAVDGSAWILLAA